MDETENRRAMDKALHYLGYRARSVAQMRTYLAQKGFSDSTIDTTLDKLHNYGYLDDGELAARIVAASEQERGVGKRVVQQKLYRAGIDADLAKQAVADMDPAVERANARAWAAKISVKLTEPDPRKRKEKLYRRLLAKGFGYDVASEAIADMIENGDDGSS